MCVCIGAHTYIHIYIHFNLEKELRPRFVLLEIKTYFEAMIKDDGSVKNMQSDKIAPFKSSLCRIIIR